MKPSLSKDYLELLADIKRRIRSAQYEALKAVNKELITLYWDIGRLIVERQKGPSHGKSVVYRLGKDLQVEFPGMPGFSARNIWYMREFYIAYRPHAKLQPLVAEIGWTHNLIIMTRCRDVLEREYDIRMTRRCGWTKNILMHQIENRTYEKTLLNQSNFDRALPKRLVPQAKLAIKDEYTFDFLDLAAEHSEKELEQAIMSRSETFLREMGGMFTFVGR
jgi:predicted nuclease of restriction endonuclease-like (RecB) superfamily